MTTSSRKYAEQNLIDFIANLKYYSDKWPRAMLFA